MFLPVTFLVFLGFLVFWFRFVDTGNSESSAILLDNQQNEQPESGEGLGFGRAG